MFAIYRECMPGVCHHMWICLSPIDGPYARRVPPHVDSIRWSYGWAQIQWSKPGGSKIHNIRATNITFLLDPFVTKMRATTCEHECVLHLVCTNRSLRIYLVLVCVCLVHVWSPPLGTDHPQSHQLKFQKLLMAAGCLELLLWRQILELLLWLPRRRLNSLREGLIMSLTLQITILKTSRFFGKSSWYPTTETSIRRACGPSCFLPVVKHGPTDVPPKNKNAIFSGSLTRAWQNFAPHRGGNRNVVGWCGFI